MFLGMRGKGAVFYEPGHVARLFWGWILGTTLSPTVTIWSCELKCKVLL